MDIVVNERRLAFNFVSDIFPTGTSRVRRGIVIGLPIFVQVA
jgi:hypothetical protein